MAVDQQAIGIRVEQEQRYYPNKIGRIFLLAMEEIMGKNGVNAVLNLVALKHLINNYPPNNLEKKFSFIDYAKLNQGIEEMYGPRGARGLIMRAGRASFKYGIKEFGTVLGIADLAFKLMPLSMKMKVGLNAMAETFDRFSDQKTHVEELKDRYIYVIEKCPVCWGRKADHPICYAAVGLLQEGLAWVSSGKTYKIEQTTCRAMGHDACRFVIEKKPVDAQ